MSELSLTSLLLSSSLVLIAILISYAQKLNLGKEICIAAVRCVVQLVAVGYILQLIFDNSHPIITTTLVLIIIFNASWNAAKRGEGIPHAFAISFFSILVASAIVIAILLLTHSISYAPNQVIPISGMIVGNAMTALGLSYRQMKNSFKAESEKVEAMLALGADIYPASHSIIRNALQTAMQPTLDSLKTVGLVSLPGMMTGQILAGQEPLQAIKYQIMVMFMILAASSIVSFLASYIAYRGFFTANKQLIHS